MTASMLTPKLQTLICEYYQRPMAMKNIARLLGISTTLVRRALAASGTPKRPQGVTLLALREREDHRLVKSERGD